MLPITHTSVRAVRLLCLAGAILATAARPSRADDPVPALLAQPISPGTLASLLAHPDDPRVEQRWREGLADANAATRAAAARLLLVSEKGASTTALMEALTKEPDEGAAREQAIAVLGLTTSGGESAVLEAVRRFGSAQFAGSLSEMLTRDERAALGVTPALPKGPTDLDDPEAARSGEYHRIRTIGGLPDGFVADVIRVTGCSGAPAGAFGGATVAFDETGTPRVLKWIDVARPDACRRAARQITAASLIPVRREDRGDLPHLLLLPVHQTFLECLARDPSASGPIGGSTQPARVGQQGVRPPDKTRHANPAPPPTALAAGQQKAVSLDVTIGASGCVGRINVLRSAGTELDALTIQTISHWAFKPTMLNGSPTPVVLPVMMNFAR